MSVSRRNWSALSSLARQWTMEDEEEAERERRRRVKSSSSTCDLEEDISPAPTDQPTTNHVADSLPETAPSSSSAEQMQVDFMEMLRVRDEKQRVRQVETLRHQRRVEENEEATPYVPKNFSGKRSAKVTNREQENGEPSGNDPVSRSPSTPTPKFISSVSISIDKSPTSPKSSLSLTDPGSPTDLLVSACQSPTSNGHGEVFQTSDLSSSINNSAEQAVTPVFVRKSSRTISFRMLRKKEEETSPLQRSSSVRIASKKFETNTVKNPAVNEQKSSPFQRNSVQRVSSRSIQEKMEMLAQAAQKSGTPRSPDVNQRTFYLLDEVSRKRSLFEKEQQAVKPTSPSKHEFRGFASGISSRINRWLDSTNQTGCSSSPTDLKHVDITSKRSLFEDRSHDSDVTKSKP
ncbi:ladinin-1 isoform X2 [Entelurus aequoreus]|uniref:ladinin-1 isoform X2 n=1 Tax=Entelurus aequoreus TaxID=161455 RepID=UPI002B1E5D2D|nr:ladinin-1 isoform X2 [Entelurus aequoreus]